MPCGVASSSLDRVERLDAALRPSVDADAGHDREALRLDPDLALGVRVRADRVAEEVVRAQEPARRPSRARATAARISSTGLAGLRRASSVRPRRRASSAYSAPYEDELRGDEHRLGGAAGLVLRRLERLAGRRREAVEVEAVVPVGAADQRQAVRAAVVEP